MDIFYIDLNTFDKTLLNEFANNSSDNKKYSNTLKMYQHFAGLYLVKKVANDFYDMKNTEIVYEKGKPFFANSQIHFSISHCENFVLCAFSKEKIGIDIENNQKIRDFAKIIKRLKQTVKTQSNDLQKDFYDFWTQNEAKYKADIKEKNIFTAFNYELINYTICVACEKNFEIGKLIEIKQ